MLVRGVEDIVKREDAIESKEMQSRRATVLDTGSKSFQYFAIPGDLPQSLTIEVCEAPVFIPSVRCNIGENFHQLFRCCIV